jgi:hypothetical protein
MLFVVLVVKKNEFVDRIYSLLFEGVYLIEIVFLIVEVLTEEDSMVVGHYYKIEIVDYYYYYYYYLLDIGLDTTAVLVLVGMLVMDLYIKKKQENCLINF